MRAPIVIVGIGQLGAVFAHGFLRAGRTVVPVTRSMAMSDIAAANPSPELVLVAVAEADIDDVLAAVPGAWRDRIALLQNELLPSVWEQHGIVDPTVVAVWFEKKRNTGITEILPSPISGPRAGLIAEALTAVGIGTLHVDDITDDLILKNLYILVANIAGLESGGTVGELWDWHRDLVGAVADDVLTLQEAMTGRTVDRQDMVAALGEAFLADPGHGSRGRSAPARLKRAIGHADRLGLTVPTLRRIAAEHGDTAQS